MYCSKVDFWKKDYPNYETQLTKEFINGEIELQLNDYEKQDQKSQYYESKLFIRFYKVIINAKQNFEDKQIILNYLDIKPDEANVIFNLANLINFK